MRQLFVGIILILCCGVSFSQDNSDKVMAVDLMTTYGNMATNDSIDDACSRTIFFVLPENYTGSFYVRIFDPDCGGANDNSIGLWETNTEFEVFGGAGCIKMPGAESEDQESIEGSGTLLQEKLFADESAIDGTWVTFGPFKAEQGEKLEEYSARFFKLVVGGTTGDDGNQYAVFLSISDDRNEELNGASIYKDSYAFSEDLKGGKYNYSISAEPVE